MTRLASTDDEDILASLNENSLEYLILKKALRKANTELSSVESQVVKKKDPLAFSITSFTLSIVGFFFASLIFGSLAIIFAAIALSRYRKFGGKFRGLAIAGMILGIVEVAIMLAALAAA